MSDVVFAAYSENVMAIAPHIAERMLIDLARFEIEAFERTRALADPTTPEVAQLELDRELALQDTLRRAIFLGDRSVAQKPLVAVAKRLNIKLDDDDPDFKALAYEATKTLLDVSREREKRRLGHYDEPTVYFRHATRPVVLRESASALPAQVGHTTPAPAVEPADFAVTSNIDYAQSAYPPESVAAHDMTCEPSAPAPSKTPAAPIVPHATPREMEKDAIIPVNFTVPEDTSPLEAQRMRVAMRPPMLHFEQRLLSDEMRAVLEKPRGITIPEAVQLHSELRSLGYGDDFMRPQKRDRKKGDEWAQENRSLIRFGKLFWSELLGDGPIDEIPTEGVNDALQLLWRVPVKHNKGPRFSTENGYLDLIERCDTEDQLLELEIEKAKKNGALSAELDRMRASNKNKRFRGETYLKHARRLGTIGRMLWDMQLIDFNPFAVCTWSSKDEKEMKKREETKARIAWDDRIHDLFKTWPFRGELDDLGEPLFWAPLIGRFQGLRMEECLQLKTGDFGSENGIPYLKVRNSEENNVKSDSGERQLPVHSTLIGLDLLKLVEL